MLKLDNISSQRRGTVNKKNTEKTGTHVWLQ